MATVRALTSFVYRLDLELLASLLSSSLVIHRITRPSDKELHTYPSHFVGEALLTQRVIPCCQYSPQDKLAH